MVNFQQVRNKKALSVLKGLAGMKSVLILVAVTFFIGVYWYISESETLSNSDQSAPGVEEISNDVSSTSKNVSNQSSEELEARVKEADYSELYKMAQLPDQEFVQALQNYSTNTEEFINNLLLLIESGRLDIDESISPAGPHQAFNPLSLAVALTNGNVSKTQFDRFIEAGMVLQYDDVDTEIIGNIDNIEVLNSWYDQASLGPEQHEVLLNRAVMTGNLSLSTLIMEQKNGRFDGLKLDEPSVLTAIETIELLMPNGRKDLNALKPIERSSYENGVRNSIQRIQILEQYADLNDEQESFITEAKEKLRIELERLKS